MRLVQPPLDRSFFPAHVATQVAQHGSGMPVPDWAQMGLTVFGPGELNHVAPKLRMDSRDIRFPFGHSRPCQLTPLLACASSKTSAPLHGRGFFLSAWSFSAGSRCRRPALCRHGHYALFDGDPVRPLIGHTALTGGDQQRRALF